MFYLICVAVLMVLGFIPKIVWGWTVMEEKCGLGGKWNDVMVCKQIETDVNAPFIFSMIFFGVAACWLFIAAMIALSEYAEQVKERESITEDLALTKLAKKRWLELGGMLREYLGKAYPEHEREIMASMSPKELQAYGVKFPQLHASETFLNLVEQLTELYDLYFRRCESVEASKREMRYRVRDPWVIGASLFPKLDEDKAKVPAEDMI